MIKDKLKQKVAKEQIDLGIDDELFIHGMTGKVRSELISVYEDVKDNPIKVNAAIVWASLYDSDGNRVFDSAEEVFESMLEDDITKAAKVSSRVNKLDKASAEETKKN